MFLIDLTQFIFCSILLNSLAHGHLTYLMEFPNTDIYEECSEYPDKFMDNIIDLSNVNFDDIGEGNIWVHGTVIVLKTLPEPYPLSMEVFQLKKGVWEPTVFTSKRPDLCKALFDPKEAWHSYVESTPEEQRICPLTEGHILEVNYTTDGKVQATIGSGGEFKMHFRVGSAPSDEHFVCANTIIRFHRA